MIELKKPQFVREWSPEPKWKADLIAYCQEQSGIKTFIETGTYMGGMISVQHKRFDYLASVELSDYFFNLTAPKFRGVEKIRLYHGSSKALIGKMIEEAPQGPILFWLDAHACGNNTGDDGEQLSHEIAAVAQHRPESLVIVDDIVPSGPDYAGPWGPLELSGWNFKFLHGELVMCRADNGRLSKLVAELVC